MDLLDNLPDVDDITLEDINVFLLSKWPPNLEYNTFLIQKLPRVFPVEETDYIRQIDSFSNKLREKSAKHYNASYLNVIPSINKIREISDISIAAIEVAESLIPKIEKMIRIKKASKSFISSFRRSKILDSLHYDKRIVEFVHVKAFEDVEYFNEEIVRLLNDVKEFRSLTDAENNVLRELTTTYSNPRLPIARNIPIAEAPYLFDRIDGPPDMELPPRRGGTRSFKGKARRKSKSSKF